MDQVAVGYFRNFKDNTYSLEVETYYKESEKRLIILMVPI
jgi:hypothetical protein